MNSVTISTHPVRVSGGQVVEPRGQTAPGDIGRDGGKSDLSDDKHTAKSLPGDVGTALRDAFRATVDEDVPLEMLDLLRRLD